MPEFIEAFPVAEGRPLAPLVAPEFTSSWLRQAHQQARTLGAVHALGVWAAEDVSVAGYTSDLFIDGERFGGASIVPAYVEKLIADGAVLPSERLDLPQRVIEEPVVAFMGWGQEVYGAALIELAPKIRIASRALGVAPERLCFMLPDTSPGWLRQLFDLAGARRFVEYDQSCQRLLLLRAWVATVPTAVAIHPACNDMFEEMCPPALEKARDALFVTRRRASVTRAIALLNAEEIEAIAECAGLRVVSPEHMPVAGQARLFGNARLVVGEYGSGLMNAAFCRPGAIVGAVGSRSQLLSAISALRGLRLGPIGLLAQWRANREELDCEALAGFALAPAPFCLSPVLDRLQRNETSGLARRRLQTAKDVAEDIGAHRRAQIAPNLGGSGRQAFAFVARPASDREDRAQVDIEKGAPDRGFSDGAACRPHESGTHRRWRGEFGEDRSLGLEEIPLPQVQLRRVVKQRDAWRLLDEHLHIRGGGAAMKPQEVRRRRLHCRPELCLT